MTVIGAPDTSYARTRDGVHVAYQILGDGPLDLLCAGYGNMVSIDMRDEEPHFERFERRLASFSRYIRFDPRGLGLSDPLAAGASASVEQGVDDLVSVLDAVGSERAALFAVGGSTLTALVAAASHPERVGSLVLVNGHARRAWADDYPCGIPKQELDRFIDAVLNLSGEADMPVDDVKIMVPSLASDPDFRAWWKRAGQRSASPATARAMLTMMYRADVRATLPLITAPTLLIHRVRSMLPVEMTRYLADHLSNARLIELPGSDHFPYAGDSDALVEEVEEFLTGVRGQTETDRVLATILFTDIVGSTRRAAQSGDRSWHDLLDRHDRMVREKLRRFRGHEIKTTGDGVLATFDGPARAMRCAQAICADARRLGIEVRAGLHTGEVEVRGDDVSGIAVHTAQRVSALAAANEVLVSRTVVDLVAGSGIEFEDRGEHELKGVPGTWRLYAVEG
ncbi:MAG TPA: adenylate/guanylate cyclase domain-containing protein [Acidimicrobiales bacterium]|nr:adenylate/guanylate cyclase domain-containing protein [Acidimicrobiales bacterium]